MLGRPRIRLNKLKTSLRFPYLGLNPIIVSINHSFMEKKIIESVLYHKVFILFGLLSWKTVLSFSFLPPFSMGSTVKRKEKVAPFFFSNQFLSNSTDILLITHERYSANFRKVSFIVNE